MFLKMTKKKLYEIYDYIENTYGYDERSAAYLIMLDYQAGRVDLHDALTVVGTILLNHRDIYGTI